VLSVTVKYSANPMCLRVTVNISGSLPSRPLKCRRVAMLHRIIIASLAMTVMFGQEGTPDARLRHATAALREIMGSPDREIPHDLIERSQCVVVVPDLLKGAFLVGGKYGRGFASCRRGGGWSAPAAVRIEGGSFGFQLGGSATDLVMLVMDRHGMDRLLGDKFTIGGEAAAAAGPTGRDTTAQTDVLMRAEILSWSRSRGLFAGVSLDGATLRPDSSENRKLYGRHISNREILETAVVTPRDAWPFVTELALISRAEVFRIGGGGGGESGTAPAQSATTGATQPPPAAILPSLPPTADSLPPPPLPADSATAPILLPLTPPANRPSPPADKPLAPIAPPPPPPDQPVASAPPTILAGMSVDQVVALLGQPDKIADLGSKKIYSYPTQKVTFIDSKVSPVQGSSATQSSSIPVLVLFEIALGVLVAAAAAGVLLARRSRFAGMVPPVRASEAPLAGMPPVPPPLPPVAQSAPPQTAASLPQSEAAGPMNLVEGQREKDRLWETR
jgi:SH3 domain-containing YSC84-like protein 1